MRWTSEQAQRRGAVAHQQVFGLLIGIQRHLVRFPTDAGLFIAAERRMRRVDMIAVGPHATGFNAATHAIGEVGIPRPHPGAETKLGLIGDSQRFRFVA